MEATAWAHLPLAAVLLVTASCNPTAVVFCTAPSSCMRYGVAVPTRLRHGDTWHTDVCRIEVVAFGPQAATIGTALHKGRGVLIEGCLRWRRWKQEGQYYRTREVIAERMQCLSHPRADVLEVAGGRSASRRA